MLILFDFIINCFLILSILFKNSFFLKEFLLLFSFSFKILLLLRYFFSNSKGAKSITKLLSNIKLTDLVIISLLLSIINFVSFFIFSFNLNIFLLKKSFKKTYSISSKLLNIL